jgi:hypothetical protein
MSPPLSDSTAPFTSFALPDCAAPRQPASLAQGERTGARTAPAVGPAFRASARRARPHASGAVQARPRKTLLPLCDVPRGHGRRAGRPRRFSSSVSVAQELCGNGGRGGGRSDESRPERATVEADCPAATSRQGAAHARNVPRATGSAEAAQCAARVAHCILLAPASGAARAARQDESPALPAGIWWGHASGRGRWAGGGQQGLPDLRQGAATAARRLGRGHRMSS